MKEIPLTQGNFALVDDSDFDWLNQWKWQAMKGNKTWYAVRSVYSGESREFILMHRVILNAPDHLEGDHRDGNGLHNSRGNLRLATKSQNAANHGKRSDNKSGYKGVHWFATSNKWQSQIRVEGKNIHLGYFADLVQAAHAYDVAAIEHFGEFAYLNFPGTNEEQV